MSGLFFITYANKGPEKTNKKPKITSVNLHPSASIERTIRGIKKPPKELPPITQLIAVALL